MNNSHFGNSTFPIFCRNFPRKFRTICPRFRKYPTFKLNRKHFRVFLGCASSSPYVSFVLSKLPAKSTVQLLTVNIGNACQKYLYVSKSPVVILVISFCVSWIICCSRAKMKKNRVTFRRRVVPTQLSNVSACWYTNLYWPLHQPRAHLQNES